MAQHFNVFDPAFTHPIPGCFWRIVDRHSEVVFYGEPNTNRQWMIWGDTGSLPGYPAFHPRVINNISAETLRKGEAQISGFKIVECDQHGNLFEKIKATPPQYRYFNYPYSVGDGTPFRVDFEKKTIELQNSPPNWDNTGWTWTYFKVQLEEGNLVETDITGNKIIEQLAKVEDRQAPAEIKSLPETVKLGNWKHRSGNVYTVIGTGNLQTGKPLTDTARLVIYVDEDGQYWARPILEFIQRFTKVENRKEPGEEIPLHMPLTLHGAASAAEYEAERATKLHPTFPTLHHAYAVIQEELDEVWDEIKKKEPDKAALKKELIQAAAMAIRAVVDLGL